MVRMSLCGHIPLTSHYVYYTTSTYVYRELNGILVYLSILLIHVQSVSNGLLVYLRILSVYTEHPEMIIPVYSTCPLH